MIIKPIFRIFDYQKAIDHYVGWMGFVLDWEHQFEPATPYYLQLSFRDFSLHLSEHSGDCSPGARIHVEDFVGLEEYHRELLAKEYRYNRPGIGPAWWNPDVLTMETIDPFGNKITFSGI